MTKPDSSQQKYPAKGQKELTETQEIKFKPKKKLFGFFFFVQVVKCWNRVARDCSLHPWPEQPALGRRAALGILYKCLPASTLL